MASLARVLALGSELDFSQLGQGRLGQGAGPSVAPQFSADLDLEIDQDGSFPAQVLSSSLVYDAKALRFRFDLSELVPQLGPDAIITQQEFAYSNDTLQTVQNGQCLGPSGAAAGGGFFAQFGWLSLAQHQGASEVRGRSCELYNFSSPAAQLSICLDGDEPLQVNSSIHTPALSMTQVQTFRNFRREVHGSLLPPDSCQSGPKTCGSGNVTSRTVYIFHPADNFDIAGQDVADLLGDATFLCSDKFMWTAGGYSLFSAFEVSWLEEFGQYANCPPDPSSPTGANCFGGDEYHVGRSTAFLMGENQGQCGEAPEFFERLGVWYSMPLSGRCKTGETLGKDCTWRTERRVKTVDMACLFESFGLEALCANASAPYTEVALAMIKALDSSAVAEGGCPAVDTASCSAHPGCEGLVGDCCPAADGAQLACCSQAQFLV